MFTNDLSGIVKSPCLIYADDLNPWSIVIKSEGQIQFQRDSDAVNHWSKKWRLPLNRENASASRHAPKGHTTQSYTFRRSPLRKIDGKSNLGHRHFSVEDLCLHRKNLCSCMRHAGCHPMSTQSIVVQSLQAKFDWSLRECCAKLKRVERASNRPTDSLRVLSYKSRLQTNRLLPEACRRARGGITRTEELGPRCPAEFPFSHFDQTRRHTLTLKSWRLLDCHGSMSFPGDHSNSGICYRQLWRLA